MNTENNFMEQNESEMEARLWAYIDGVSEEKSIIEKLLTESRQWKEKYTELLDVHQLIANTELEQPSLRFTKNVMEEIARLQIAPATKEYINKKIIWGLAVFFLLMLAGFLVYGIAQVDWSAAGSSSNAIGIDLSAVDYSKMFNNTLVNVFMGMNVILGLLLLDRFLSVKRKQFLNAE